MEVNASNDQIRVVDRSGKALTITPDGWESAADPPAVQDALAGRIDGPDEPTEVVAGRTTGLTFPGVHVNAVSMTTGERVLVDSDGQSSTLGADRWLFKTNSSIRCYVCFEASARIVMPSQEEARLRFPTRTGVSIGLVSSVEPPPATVTVPRTPEGVARWLTVAATTPETTTALRSWPSLRPRLPAVECGDAVEVPADLDTAGGSDVLLRVAPSFTQLFSVAPLAYYLGATVEVTPTDDPQLVAGSRRIDLDTGQGFHDRTNRLLRRVFVLDCLVRSADEYGRAVAAADRLPEMGIDADRLVDAPIRDRVVRYVEAPFDRIDEFPPWHLSMAVEASAEIVPALPAVVSMLPYVRPPENRWIDNLSRVTVPEPGRSPGEAIFRATHQTPTENATEPTDHSQTADAARRYVVPEFDDTRHHGWLADGTPVGAFDASRAAFTNRDRYVTDDGELSIVAVVNDTGFDTDTGTREGERAVTQYRRRIDRFEQDVTLRRNLSVAELARTIESGGDVFHFIGHHDDGLVCPDGRLETVNRSNVRVFLLNACGSYPFGRRLVEHGSVAGGVTRAPVMNETAVAVGVRFARFLLTGNPVAVAMDGARYGSIAPKEYGVVGDGTHHLTKNDGTSAARVRIDPIGDDRFRKTKLTGCLGAVGGQSSGMFDDRPRLYGRTWTQEITRDQLHAFLDVLEKPVVYEDTVCWPERLRERL